MLRKYDNLTSDDWVYVNVWDSWLNVQRNLNELGRNADDSDTR